MVKALVYWGIIPPSLGLPCKGYVNTNWLVVYLPLWKMMDWNPVGMIIPFPTEWKVMSSIHVPPTRNPHIIPKGRESRHSDVAWLPRHRHCRRCRRRRRCQVLRWTAIRFFHTLGMVGDEEFHGFTDKSLESLGSSMMYLTWHYLQIR